MVPANESPVENVDILGTVLRRRRDESFACIRIQRLEILVEHSTWCESVFLHHSVQFVGRPHHDRIGNQRDDVIAQPGFATVRRAVQYESGRQSAITTHALSPKMGIAGSISGWSRYAIDLALRSVSITYSEVRAIGDISSR